MFGKVSWNFGVTQSREPFPQHPLHEQLFLYPREHCRHKAHETAGREGVVRFKKPLELEEGFLVKRHRGKILVIQAGFLQNVAASVNRKRRIMLFSRESFFLSRGDNFSVHENRGSAVVIERGYTQNRFFHSNSFCFAPAVRRRPKRENR